MRSSTVMSIWLILIVFKSISVGCFFICIVMCVYQIKSCILFKNKFKLWFCSISSMVSWICCSNDYNKLRCNDIRRLQEEVHKNIKFKL
jgi:hypothetical protein